MFVTTGADSTSTGGRPVALFVLGMHRSGTAALTRVLSLCGGSLPAGLAGANAANPRGFWEPRKAIYLNESILHRYRSNWADPSLRLQEEGAFDAEDREAHVAEIRGYLTTLPSAPLVIIKEPRISLLSELWFEAARAAGFDPVAVTAMRHPQEVIGSLATRDGASPELASALWLKYTLLAERDTRGVPRIFLDYANLLDDWRREVTRIATALAIDLSSRDDEAVDAFLKPDLRRERHSGPIAEFFGAAWVSAVYEALCAAARDEPWEESVLDRVFQAYAAAEHGFRIAFDDFHDRFTGVLSRPAVQKVIGEVVAMAHRRSGTWA